MSVRILSADDGEFLRGDARETGQVVGERFGDGAARGVVRRGEAEGTVEEALEGTALDADALGQAEAALAPGCPPDAAIALVVIELGDVAVGEMAEYGRLGIVLVDGPVLILRPHAHHSIADLGEEVLLDRIEEGLVTRAGEAGAQGGKVVRAHSGLEAVREGADPVTLPCLLSRLAVIPRKEDGLLQDILRHGRHARRMGPAG